VDVVERNPNHRTAAIRFLGNELVAKLVILEQLVSKGGNAVFKLVSFVAYQPGPIG